MMLFSCAASNASAICFAMVRGSSTGTAPSRLTRSASVSPGISSITRQDVVFETFDELVRGKVPMSQICEKLCAPRKTSEPIIITSEGFWQNLDGDVAP